MENETYIKKLLHLRGVKITSDTMNQERNRLSEKHKKAKIKKEEKRKFKEERESVTALTVDRKREKNNARRRELYRIYHPKSFETIPEYRICSKCGIEKPLTEIFFAKRKRVSAPPFRNDCLECQKEYRRPWQNKRYRENLKFKLNVRIGNAIRWNLAGGKGRDLVAHIEKQFRPGMAWDNYGISWHIDHKTPVAAFNFTTPDDIDFKRCWSLQNLQPLPAHENIIKSDKIDRPFQPSLSLGGIL